jgi:hypothetical protein
LVADIAEANIPALLGQRHASGASDAATAAGDEGGGFVAGRHWVFLGGVLVVVMFER